MVNTALETEILFGDFSVYDGWKISKSVFVIKEIYKYNKGRYNVGDQVRLISSLSSAGLNHPTSKRLVCVIKSTLPPDFSSLWTIRKEGLDVASIN